MKILITDGLSSEGLDILNSAPELEVVEKKGISKEELLEEIKNYNGLIVRSATKVTKEVIDASEGSLKVVGRAGIGVDNVDVEYATKNGIVVMNTPEANAITTAEHTITLLCSLARNIPQAHRSLKEGRWDRSKYKGIELFGKTIGFVGLGNIGKLVAERAIGLKMNAIAFDPFITPEATAKIGVDLVTLDELIEKADIISVHTPLNAETKDLINKDSIARMKDGVLILNCARGGIINEQDLTEAITSGKVAGAGIDVYTSEPVEQDNPLLTLDENIVITPHLGASTEEAQKKVGLAIAEQIVNFGVNGVVQNAVNMPSLSLEQLKSMKPYLDLAEKIGSLQGQLCKGAVKQVNLEYDGEVSNLNTDPLTVAALKGFLSPMMDIPVSFVNAPVIAKERGIKVIESKSETSKEYTSLINMTVKTSEGKTGVSGTIYGKGESRIVWVNGMSVDVVPQGHLLISENYDKPGFIGSMASLLGDKGVNIGLMHLGREKIGGRAIVFTNVDSPLSEDIMNELSVLPDIISVTQVKF